MYPSRLSLDISSTTDKPDVCLAGAQKLVDLSIGGALQQLHRAIQPLGQVV